MGYLIRIDTISFEETSNCNVSIGICSDFVCEYKSSIIFPVLL